jgi:hypothetical protein
MTDRTPTKKRGQKFGLTAVLGVVMVPAAAIVAVALLQPATTTETEPVDVELAAATEVAVDSPNTTEFVIEPVTSSDDDLIAACTEDGLWLVALEGSGEITELQAAALDALRQLCEEAGMPLPGPPAPPAVVRTVKVVKTGGGGGGGGGGGDDHHHDDDDHEDDDDEHGEESSEVAAQYDDAHRDAKKAIAAAREKDPDSDDLQEAYEKLDEAERKATKGDYREAIVKARDAERKAKEALHG